MMPYRDACRFGSWLILLSAGAAACSSDNLSAPGTSGTLEITTTTAGAETDPDGYTVQVDGDNPQPIGSAATISRSNLSTGNHTVQLGGLAANCAVTGDNPRTVSVPAGQTMTVTFAVTCGAVSGGLQVSASTSGPSPDADGYSITVDGTEAGTVAASAAVNLAGVTAGPHEIGLSGVAGNCTVSGDNPQSVTVPAGATATISFAVTCAAASADAGSLRITTATTGADPDANGYRVAVDGGSTQPIGVNASTTIANVPAGSHSVRLSGLATNCTAQGANPRSVNLAAGATAEVSFAVSCSATSGSLQISTSTTGSNPDPDGYAVSVDGAAARSIGVNATLPIAGVAAGAHQVALSGLAANCSVQGGNPQPVTVTVGATVSVAFTISCPPPAGSSWTPMASGTSAELTHVTGSSATNVFAAGWACQGTVCGGITILHYDGRGWSSQLSESSGAINDLWAAPNGEAFATKAGPIEMPASILHYDGQQWSAPAAQPANPSEETTLNGIWGSSPTDVFAVGYWFTSSSDSYGYIVHFDGVQWSKMEITNQRKGEFLILRDVWGTSATDVYAVGRYEPYDSELTDFRAVILHFDGQAWTEVLRQPDMDLRHIWGTSATDVYASGVQGGKGAIWHFDGHQWSPLPIPATRMLGTIWGSSSRDIYVVSLADAPSYTSPNLWHFDGAAWQEIHPSANGLYDVWGSSATDVFLVGTNGTILHGP